MLLDIFLHARQILMINLTRFLRVGIENWERTFVIVMVPPPSKERKMQFFDLKLILMYVDWIYPWVLTRHSYIPSWFLCRFNLFWLSINFSLCSTSLWVCFIRYFLFLSISSVVNGPDFLMFLVNWLVSIWGQHWHLMG